MEKTVELRHSVAAPSLLSVAPSLLDRSSVTAERSEESSLRRYQTRFFAALRMTLLRPIQTVTRFPNDDNHQ